MKDCVEGFVIKHWPREQESRVLSPLFPPESYKWPHVCCYNWLGWCQYAVTEIAGVSMLWLRLLVSVCCDWDCWCQYAVTEIAGVSMLWLRLLVSVCCDWDCWCQYAVTEIAGVSMLWLRSQVWFATSAHDWSKQIHPWCTLCTFLGRQETRKELLLTKGASVFWHHLVVLVVRRPPRERKILGSNPACGRIFSGLSHTSDLKIGTPVAALPGAWRYRVSTGTGRPGVSILWVR